MSAANFKQHDTISNLCSQSSSETGLNEKLAENFTHLNQLNITELSLAAGSVSQMSERKHTLAQQFLLWAVIVGFLKGVKTGARHNHAATKSRRTQNLTSQNLAATKSLHHKISQDKNRAMRKSRR
jgi:hypothetical protein